MKLPLKIGLLDMIVAIIIVAVVLLVMLPVGRAFAIFPVLLAAYMIPCVLYRRTSYYSPIGQLALSVAFIMMTLFAVLNLWQSTILLGSVDAPFLLHDAYSFHRLAQDLAYDTMSAYSPIVPYMGYPYFLSLWLSLGINDIAYPVVANIFALLISLLLVGRLVVFVVGQKPYTTRMAAYAMMLTAVVPGVMATATQLSKEPFVIVSLLMCIVALYAIKQRYKVWQYMVMLVIGLCVLSLCRPTYIYVLLIYMMAIWLYKFTRRDMALFVTLLAVVLCALHVGVQSSWWGSSNFISAYVENEGHSAFYYGESQKPMYQIVGDYNEYPIWKKLLILPFTVAVQFMIPFPFETAPEAFGMPLSSAYNRMSYLWYMAALPMLLFYLMHWFRKDCDTRLSLLAFASAAAYCVPAFISGGVVSRYAFCFVPMLSIIGAYVLAHLVTYSKRRRKIAVAFAVVYVGLISIALYVGAHPSIIL